MCGIAGYFSLARIADSSSILESMLDAIAHRGPDGTGQSCFDQAGLGHVRLAIIDIAGGLQPMCTSDRRFWISYNGELYNYLEIRKNLQLKGITFQTNSDTEVILKAFRHSGTSCLNDFRGMFAFAIWDDKNKEGFLVRDSLGIKPLFYTSTGQQVTFASEVKGLLKFPGIKAELDLQSLHLLMNFRYIPGSTTMFRNIVHLPPGHYMHWQNGNHTLHEWCEKQAPLERIPSVDEIGDALAKAVSRQLVSDVPLGSYLSAGIDSATILALSMKGISQDHTNFPTFTIQTGDSPLEHVHAAETARFFQVPNFQREVETRLDKHLSRLIWHLEVPKVNAYQSALVAQLARKHVKVALSGLGGDEIFLGYNIHRYLNRLANLHAKTGVLPKLAGRIMHPFLASCGIHFEEFARGCHALAALPDYARVYGIIRNVWDAPGTRKRMYGPRMLSQSLGDPFSLLEQTWQNNTHTPVEDCSVFELNNKMVNDLLLQEDRLSMAFGLEVRVPFLDEDLVKLVTGIPSKLRMPRGQLKGLMKNVVSQWLPQSILDRPKSGFQLPIHDVFNSHLKPLALEYLSADRLKSDGLFNHIFVTNVLNAKPDIRLRWHYFILYLMIGTTLWIDLFEKNEPLPSWS